MFSFDLGSLITTIFGVIFGAVITRIFYYHDESLENSHYLLLSTSYDSLINVYNEENPEETEKLRTIHGGHTLKGKVLEINCMDFSILLNGSSDQFSFSNSIKKRFINFGV